MKKSLSLVVCLIVLAITPAFATKNAVKVVDLKLTVDQKEIDRNAPQLMSYAPVVEKAKHSVVSVYTANIVKVQRGGLMTPHEQFMRRFFGMPMPDPRQGQQGQDNSTEERRLPQGIGSGVILTAEGYILTNNHVVANQNGEDADEVMVQLSDGREFSAKIVGRDPGTDVAVLKIETSGLPAIRIADSDKTMVGDTVFAIGNPLGVGLTVTRGIISAMGRKIGIYGKEGYESFIQTDASINPGNSGGALIDVEGRLIGVNSAIASRTGGSVGLGFAIPGNLALNVIRNLLEYGEIRRGFLGIAISDITPEKAEVFGLKDSTGVLVDNVEKGLPAEMAGVERGDIILELDGKQVTNGNDLRLNIAQRRPGSEVAITVFRNGKKKVLNAKLGDLDKHAGESGDRLFEGVKAVALDERMRQEYSIPATISGLVITEVEPKSPFSRHLREGIVILEVNDKKVQTLTETRSLLRKGLNKIYIFDRSYVRYLVLNVN